MSLRATPSGSRHTPTNSPVSSFVGGSAKAPILLPLASPLPAGPVAFTMQWVSCQAAANIAGGVGATCTMLTGNSARPALWGSY